MLEFHCDACRQLLKAPESVAGKAVRCPNCKAVMTVPQPADEPLYDEPPEEVSVGELPAVELPPSRMPWETSGPEGNTEHDADEMRLAPLDTPVNSPRPSPASPPLLRREPTGPPAFSGVDANASLPQFHGSGSGYRPRFFYLLFALTLVPLAFSLLGEKDDTLERCERTLAIHPEIRARLPHGQVETEEDLDEICADVPEGKIEGALLPRQTWTHWILAVVAGLFALAFLLALFDRGDAKFWHLPVSALFTATFGIAFLFLAQFLAAVAPKMHFRAWGKLAIIMIVLWAIAMMYNLAEDPTAPFVLSLLGFTFGVGLCEEMT